MSHRDEVQVLADKWQTAVCPTCLVCYDNAAAGAPWSQPARCPRHVSWRSVDTRLVFPKLTPRKD